MCTPKASLAAIVTCLLLASAGSACNAEDLYDYKLTKFPIVAEEITQVVHVGPGAHGDEILTVRVAACSSPESKTLEQLHVINSPRRAIKVGQYVATAAIMTNQENFIPAIRILDRAEFMRFHCRIK